MDICKFLINQGLIAPHHESEVKTRAREEGVSLIKTITDSELVHPETIIRSLIQNTTFDVVEPDFEDIDPDTLRLIPHEVAVKSMLLPLSFEENLDQEGQPVHLRVVVADPFLDLSEITQTTGFPVVKSLTRADLLEKAIARNYSSMITRVLPTNRETDVHNLPQKQQQIWKSAGSDKKSGLKAEGENPSEKKSRGSITVDGETKSYPPSSPLGMAEAPPESSKQAFVEPSTVPSHNIEDEVSPNIKVQALVNVLCKRGLLDRKDYMKEIRQLMETNDREP